MSSTAVFGGHQIFVALPALKSMARYALEKGALDSKLDWATWASNVFTFHVGDAANALSGLESVSSDT